LDRALSTAEQKGKEKDKRIKTYMKQYWTKRKAASVLAAPSGATSCVTTSWLTAAGVPDWQEVIGRREWMISEREGWRRRRGEDRGRGETNE
jgi:hypothetical protein